MNARRTATGPSTSDEQGSTVRAVRMIPSSSAVMSIVIRVAGIVPVRLDLAHVGTPEQQLGLSLGAVLIYLKYQELHQMSEKPQVA